MHNQQTQPNQAARTVPHKPASAAATIPSPAVAAAPVAAPPIAATRKAPAVRVERKRHWLWWAFGGIIFFFMSVCGAVTLGAMVMLNSGILPGVSVNGISVAGMSEAEAAQKLAAEWHTLTLRDGERVFQVEANTMGIMLDAQATAAQAHAQGRGAGSLFDALFGSVDVSPAVNVDTDLFRAGLTSLSDQINIPAQDAGVQVVNGQVSAKPPQSGRRVDIGATLNAVAGSSLATSEIPLVMQTVQPAITDATPLVNAAAAVLQKPLIVQVYDPVTGDIVDWAAQPGTWSAWITARADANSPLGLSLSLDTNALRQFLTEQATVLDASRRIDLDAAIANVQAGLRDGNTQTTIRVYHNAQQHTVQPGETITSIAWDYGIPYLYLQNANNGISALSAGQTITIPAADSFLEFEPIPHKRIIVSISQQRMQAYENGQLLWDWGASTGIRDSPTWPGVYQVLSHVENAYASNWNLNMPWFMGVYRPVPGSDFTNGFHGFPTRGGGQILWENSIGQRVTYGCILLSNTNVRQLWDWAEQGVVVEIRP